MSASTSAERSLLTTAYCLLSTFFPSVFCQTHQLLGHPLGDTLVEGALDADGAVVPVVALAGRAALALVAQRLVEAHGDAVDDLAPVLQLDAAADEREAGRPVLLGRARVLLGDGQGRERRHRRVAELVVEPTPQVLQREPRV